jgi:hypothetical protein
MHGVESFKIREYAARSGNPTPDLSIHNKDTAAIGYSGKNVSIIKIS